MNILLDGIISGIKNIVIIIVASEFLKVFLLGDKFRKYITVCVNIIVIGFIVGEIRNVPFGFDATFEIPEYTLEEHGNAIKDEYEKNISEALKEKMEQEKISVYQIETKVNDDYSIKNIILNINGGERNKEKAEKIIKGLKPENYEINVNIE